MSTNTGFRGEKAHTRVEICGGIASGKTTLARNLQYLGCQTVFEDFKSNPFWRLFYIDPKSHAFETEITFLLQHYNQYKPMGEKGDLLVCDASTLLDLAYADINLVGTQKSTFLAVYEEVQRNLPPPALVVHLRCSPEEELARIHARARSEEAGMKLDYLVALNNAVAKRVMEVGVDIRVLEIDSEANDFAHDDEARKRVSELVLSSVRSTG